MPLQPAILGTARLNNFRLGYVPAALVTERAAYAALLAAQAAALARQRAAHVSILIAGADARTRVRMAGFSIHDAINDEPNTCTLTVDGTAPVVGQDLRVSINLDTPRLLFNGTIQTVEQSYEGRPAQIAWVCTATDDMARLNRKRPFATYDAVSASTIAADLITRFAPGFTGTHVEGGLPAVSVTFDGSDTLSGAFAKLAQLVEGYFYVEDLDIHLFQSEPASAPADIDHTAGRFLNSPPITLRSDSSQVRNRVIGKGAGSSVSSDVSIGMTELPVSDSSFTDNTAGFAIVGADVITFAGRNVNYENGTVTTGPTANPSAPTAAVSTTKSGGPLGAIAYYKTDVNDEGESEPSPVSNTVTPATVGTPGAISSGAVQHTASGTYHSTPKDFYTLNASLSRSGSSFSFGAGVNPLVPGAKIRIFGGSTGAFDGVWTVASEASGTVTVNGISTSAPSGDTAYISFIADGPLYGTFDYGVSFVSTMGETAISGVTSVTAALHAGVGFNSSGIFTPQAGGAMTPSVNYRYWTSIRSQSGESSPIQIAQTASLGSGHGSVLISFTAGPIATAFQDLRALSMVIYRSRAGGTVPFAVATVTREQLAQAGCLDNSTNFVYTDTAADSSLTALPGNTPIGASIGLKGIPTTSDQRCTGRRLWRKISGTWYPLALIGDRATTTVYLDTTVDAELGQGALGLDPRPFGGAAVNVTVPVGASGTTSRKLYRTKAGPSAKAYFCGTLDANTITAYEDTKTDEDLGEEMLPHSRRRTLAGSTTLKVRDDTYLSSLGGWVRSGSQVFHYTGITYVGTEVYPTLVGIPASGPAAITADISTGAEVLVEPQLFGIPATGAGSIPRVILKGTAVRLYTVRNDTAAQAALVALDAAQGRTTDGIVEHVLTADVRLAELIDLCDADLARFATPQITVTFDARDTNLKSGKPITFNLTTPPISATLTLTSVDITEIDFSRAGVLPRFHCTAATTALSLASLLRRLLTKAA